MALLTGLFPLLFVVVAFDRSAHTDILFGYEVGRE